jgi:hypothetical protein
MAASTRQLFTLGSLAILGAVLVATNTHRDVIGTAWNLFTAFIETYITY